MDKNAIKKYAVWARTELIDRVTQKALQYGITEKDSVPASATSVNGVVLSKDEMQQRKALLERIAKKGYKHVIEEVAYTWFNRFSALRFMEVNGYLPSRVRVFTDEHNQFNPQILTEAISLEMAGLDMEKVYAYKDANDDEGLFKYLIIVQCNALNPVMPGMFQRIADYTELLFPDNLLREGSAVQRMIEWIPEEDWKDAIQIIGWLYQFYNIEPKAEVFAKKTGKISKEEIPAATQLFTPDWIVRYMVENSLGRLWIEGHPDENLRAEWAYYLDEAEQETEVNKQLEKIRREYAGITPEQIKCIDPCSGSGHICAYMFDVLMQIYEAYGYTARDAVRSIVENNIYGLDIDERAAQLAYFSVMMKARQYDRRYLTRKDENGNPDVPQPRVYEIVESNGLDSSAVDHFVGGDPRIKKAINSLISEMHDAKEYGSILNITPVDFDALYRRFDEVLSDVSIFNLVIENDLLPFVKVAETMAQKYDVVVTNPPYMAVAAGSAKLNDYVKKNYPESKQDMFAVFMQKCNQMLGHYAFQAMITMHSWMFLSRFEKLRLLLQNIDTICMAHLGARAFEEISGEVVQTTCFVKRRSYLPGYVGTYCRLIEAPSQDKKEQLFLSGDNRFHVSQDVFQNIYGSPVAYWISDNMMSAFRGKELGDYGKTRQGFATGDNGRFLRFWHEVDFTRISFGCRSAEDFWSSKGQYAPCNKGGEARKWYGNNYIVCKYDPTAYAELLSMGNHLPSRDYYFRSGLTWSTLGTSFLSMRYTPDGFLFETKGSMYFANAPEDTKYLLAVMNSKVAMVALQVLCPTIDFHEGPVSHVPIIVTEKDEVVRLVDENIALAKADWDSYETSWDFARHPLAQTHSIEEAYRLWEATTLERYNRTKRNEERINAILIQGYGLGDEIDASVNSKEVTISLADKKKDVKSFISYAVGCMFGRYSLDVPGLVYAGGEWNDSKYVTFKADRDSIIPICDDEYFADDIVARFVRFVETVYGRENLSDNLRFIAEALGGNGQPTDIIRKYFIDEFYSDHLKTYQKCPIYWLFDSGKKNGFKALVYMHRYQPDTIARMRTDYVHEQQARYRTVAAELEQRIIAASTGERVKLSKRLSLVQEQATEIRAYEEKIHHLADQYISLDLNNGVKGNYDRLKDVLGKIK